MTERIRRFLANATLVFEALQPLDPDVTRLQPMMRRAEAIARKLSDMGRAEILTLLRRIVSHLEVGTDQIRIIIQPKHLLELVRETDAYDGNPQPAGGLEMVEPLVLTAPIARQRTGRDTKLLVDGPEAKQADPTLIRLLIQAHTLRPKLLQSGEASLTETAAAEGSNRTYLTRIARLGFLSPEITTAILDGRQPAHFTAAYLSSLTDLSLGRAEQGKLLRLGN